MEQDYFTLQEDNQGLSVVLREHSEVKILYENRDRYPDYISINGVNPILHVQVEAMVENQLHDENLAGVREVFEKLQEEKGFTSHAARASIAQVFLVDFYALLNDEKPFDLEAYVRRLKLIGQEVSNLGRNDRCPCGSGAKFKRCCAPYAEYFSVSPMTGRLDLGYGSYMPETSQNAVDPLDPIFQLEARSHIANYMEHFKDLEGALAVLRENVAAARSYKKGNFLKNAWQDLLLLCENNPTLVEEGLETFNQLLLLAEDNQEKGMLLCDKADFLCSTDNMTAAEEEYTTLLRTFPDFHFGRYRYALFLRDYDRIQEAKSVLKDLLSINTIDEETRMEAKGLLAELKAEEYLNELDINDFLEDSDNVSTGFYF